MTIAMPPTVWGPIFWATMHIISLAYPVKPSYAEKRAAKEFFRSLTNLLPCPVCREHYAKNLQLMPIEPALDSRDDLIRWVVNLHNSVNVQNGKPIYTVDEVIRAYAEMGHRGIPAPPSPWTHKHFENTDNRAFMKGSLAGVASTLGVAGIFYLIYLSYKKE